VLATPAPLRRGDGATRRALRAQVAHRDQLRVRPVGADPPARALDQLLDLLRERIDPRPRTHRHRQPTAGSVPGRHPVRNRLVITASERRRTAQRACQVERLKDLHHFLRSLQARLLDTPR
jgi:hypothetical protein